MKLIMTLLVRDEEDIIRENIEYHSSVGVDHFIVMDNGSRDGSRDILLEYEKAGILEYIYQPDCYFQSKWATEMTQLAYRKYGADWVINNDADEFWWHKSRDLKETLEKVPIEYPLVRVQRHNMLLKHGKDDGPFYIRMTYRRKKSLNPVGKPLPSKVCLRGTDNVEISPGSHAVAHPGGDLEYSSNMEIFHYPARGRSQLINKIINIGSGYKNNPQIDKKTGNQPGFAMRTLYKEYINDPRSLDRYLSNFTVPKRSIINVVSEISNPIFQDKRMSKYLDVIMKEKQE